MGNLTAAFVKRPERRGAGIDRQMGRRLEVDDVAARGREPYLPELPVPWVLGIGVIERSFADHEPGWIRQPNVGDLDFAGTRPVEEYPQEGAVPGGRDVVTDVALDSHTGLHPVLCTREARDIQKWVSRHETKGVAVRIDAVPLRQNEVVWMHVTLVARILVVDCQHPRFDRERVRREIELLSVRNGDVRVLPT